MPHTSAPTPPTPLPHAHAHKPHTEQNLKPKAHAPYSRTDKCWTQRSGSKEDNSWTAPGDHLRPPDKAPSTYNCDAPSCRASPPRRPSTYDARPTQTTLTNGREPIPHLTSPTACGDKHHQGRWAGGGKDPSPVQSSMRGCRELGDPGREGKGPCSQ
ncbi:hypothetical protein JB92DRAFT_2826159 [Gautieria morchelliformis]|nr:hypothetical protein JB92DRAFT_2826159 [Gautieria morchelliformis]